MKDLYSFNTDEAGFREFYERCAAAYIRIFERLGLGERTYRTFASGGSFSKFSDEFQTVCDVGEDTIYVHDGKGIAINKEVYTDDVLSELGITKDECREERAVEVGNIFPLGTKYSEALGLRYRDEEGGEHPVYMGSYGIGPARVMGTIVETCGEEARMVWPKEVAPFAVHLIDVSQGDENILKASSSLYERLRAKGIEVLYDDRDMRAGEKFADADLIGIPLRATIGKKTGDGMVEVEDCQTGEKRVEAVDRFVDSLS